MGNNPYATAFSSRKLIFVGGGGGSTPTISWGPQFGELQELTTAQALDLDILGFSNQMNTISAFDLFSISQSWSLPWTTQSHLTTSLAPIYPAITTRSALTNPANAIVYNPTTTQSAFTNPANAINVNAFGTASHFTGSVLGAPFFQVASSVATTANAATATVTAPAGIQNGDLLLFLVALVNVATDLTSTPSGTTLIRTDVTTSRASSYYKIASSESGNYTFGNGNAGSSWCITCLLIRGVNQSTPINVSGGQTGSATDPIAPTVTTTVVNCLIVCWCSQVNLATSATYTAPAGYTERSDLNATNTGVSTGTSTSDTKIQAATGATGTATMNSSQLVATAYASQHLAVAPGSVVVA